MFKKIFFLSVVFNVMLFVVLRAPPYLFLPMTSPTSFGLPKYQLRNRLT